MHEKGIETFLAVAASRTLGRAAGLLNVTQSTISYNLSELESEMGMILVDRRKGVKSVKLTPAGESFLPLALKWQEVSREISDARSPGAAYSLTVGGNENVNCRLFPKIYDTLLEYEPPVYLRIVTDRSNRLYEAVENRILDAAVATREENARYVDAEPFYRESFVVARIPYRGENARETIAPSELTQANEFYIEWSAGFRLWHDHIWNPIRPFRVKLDSLNLAVSLMKRPGEWSVIPKSGAALFKKNVPGASFYKISDAPPEIVYYILTHRYPKSGSAAGISIFKEALRKKMTEEAL